MKFLQRKTFPGTLSETYPNFSSPLKSVFTLAGKKVQVGEIKV